MAHRARLSQSPCPLHACHSLRGEYASTCSTAINIGCPSFSRCRQLVLAVAVVAIRFTMEMVMVVCLARLPWPDCWIDSLSLPPPSFLFPTWSLATASGYPPFFLLASPSPQELGYCVQLLAPTLSPPHFRTWCVQQRAIHISYVHR